MVSLIAFASLGGTLLGIRYKVLVLFLASSFAFFIAVANSMSHERDLGGTALTVLAILSCLQFAYLVGNTIRLFQDDRFLATSRLRAR